MIEYDDMSDSISDSESDSESISDSESDSQDIGISDSDSDSEDIGISESDSESSGSDILVYDNPIDSDNDSDSDDDVVLIPQQLNMVGDDDDDDDEIYQEDSAHLYSEKLEGHYYIGLAKRVFRHSLLLVNSVSATTFFRYPFYQIRNYLVKYSILEVNQAKVHIMKLCITEDQTFTVVLKTLWIRLIQRHWRRVVAIRHRIMKSRCCSKNRYISEISGRYPIGLRRLPGLQGLLSSYSKKI
jgi:hypothetical protein